ncbi:unnamed protein product [Rotaria sp. Silwood1]|nr:unnamed protein product [Rotaria sp. Silwood1]
MSMVTIGLRKKKDDISKVLRAHNRLLSTLCQSSHRFIENAKEIFNTYEPISVETFTSEYRRMLSFIVSSFNVNQLLHIFRTNWLIDFTDENEHYLLKTFPKNFSSSNCSCAISSSCNEPLTDDIV